MQWANKRLFDKVKSILPKISDTELIALRSGTTSMDRDIFKGKVNAVKGIRLCVVMLGTGDQAKARTFRRLRENVVEDGYFDKSPCTV